MNLITVHSWIIIIIIYNRFLALDRWVLALSCLGLSNDTKNTSKHAERLGLVCYVFSERENGFHANHKWMNEWTVLKRPTFPSHSMFHLHLSVSYWLSQLSVNRKLQRWQNQRWTPGPCAYVFKRRRTMVELWRVLPLVDSSMVPG